MPGDIKLPVIRSVGVGRRLHITNRLDDKRIDIVATANLFNFIGDGLKARLKLLHDGYNLATWHVDKVKSCNE